MEFISQLRSFLFGSAARKYWLTAGMILVIAGQSLIREPQPLAIFKTIAKFSNNLNETFYLALNEPTSIVVGLFLIVLATLIYSRLFASTGETENEPKSHISGENWLSWKKFLPWGIVNLGLYALVMTQLARHQYSNILLWGWLTSILIFTILFWKSEQRSKPDPDSSLAYSDGIWMFALFAFAVAISSYLLNDIPVGWIPDEVQFWVTARQIALGEIAPPFFDSGVYTFPVASSILQGLIMRWTGVNLWGWRFASALPASMTVIPLYLLARELFDRRIAIASNVMMIFNPYFLTFARLGYNNSQALFPVTFCVYFLVLGFRRNSYFYLWLAGLTAGLGFYTYFAAWLGLAVIIIASFLLSRHKKFPQNIMPLILITAGALIMLLPRILYSNDSSDPATLHYKFWESAPINTFYGETIFGEDRIAQTKKFMAGGNELFYDLPLYGIIIIRGVLLSAAVLFDPITHFDHHIIFGIAGPGSSIFFIPGLGITFANLKKKQYLISSAWFLAGFFLLGALNTFPPRPTHQVTMIPVISLISAVGLVSFLDASISPRSSKFTFFWSKTATAFVLLFIATISSIQYFVLTPYIYYPPTKTEYISWLARQTPASANFFIVDSAGGDFNENSLNLPQLQSAMPVLADPKAEPSQLKTWKNFVAFVDLRSGEELASWIAGKIPNSKLQAVYAPGQRLYGYVVADIQVNASMNTSLSHGLQDLWNSPARSILLFCGTGIIALFIKMRTIKIKRQIQ